MLAWRSISNFRGRDNNRGVPRDGHVYVHVIRYVDTGYPSFGVEPPDQLCTANFSDRN